jgi:hypothetical protein
LVPVVHENAAAADRLAKLALTAADLISALIGADQEARRWTPLAPQMMAGLARWGKTNDFWTDGDDEDDLATWLLLYHVTPDQVRAELSLGNGIDRRGHISAWIERIILPAARIAECPRAVDRGHE